ncbi:hypothetical protein MHU86_17439 [Fragilaria crotonensis]|nr:hypothetical protein MHU86_17439 [Fragilaria crotonensis]
MSSPEDIAFSTLARSLKQCKEITFTLYSDGREDTHLKISAQSSRKGDEPATHSCFQLDFSKSESEHDNTETNQVETGFTSESMLEENLVLCLRSNVSDTLQKVKFASIDDRLPNFINAMLAVFTERNKPLKKLIFENCVSQQESTGSKLDAAILKQALELCEEFHLDHEDQDPGASDEVSFCLSTLSQITSLKAIMFSYTFCDNIAYLASIVTSNASLKELVLFNAFSVVPPSVQRSRLKPLLCAMRQHQCLQKFTLLQSDFDAPLYKWAVLDVLENPNVIGLCTDGYYSQNATWLGRFLASNSQLKEVNLPPPGFEYEYDRFNTRSSTLSLIQGLARNSTLTSINLFGIALVEETSLALRALIESTDTLIKLSCGNGNMNPSCLSTVMGGLFSNTSVQKFSIEAAELDLVGAHTIAEVLANNVTLQFLSICCRRRRYHLRSRPRVFDEVDRLRVTSLLADGLKENQTLKHLELPTNYHTSECLVPLLRILETKQNSTLERLTFWPKEPCSVPELQYWIRLNRCEGRKLIRASDTLPLAVWAHVLAAVARHADLVRYFVTELPSLVDVALNRRRHLVTEEGNEHDEPVKKRAKQT